MDEFNKKVVKIGTFTLIAGLLANFAPVLYIWIVKGIIPPISEIVSLYGIVAASFAVSWIVQPLSYYGGLGMVGSYISWISGSAADIRLPAITMAQRVSNTEANTPEGDAIGAMALASTVFTTVTIITIFTFIGSAIIPLLPDAVVESFTFMQPALFAAVFINMAVKNIKSGIPTLIAGLLSCAFLPVIGVKAAFITLIVVILGIVIAAAEFQISEGQGKENNRC